MNHSEEAIIKRIKEIGSTIFADVMNMPNAMDYKISPVNFSETLAGRIRTVSLPPGDNLFVHHAIYQANPGEILVVDGKGYEDAAYLGELMAGVAEKAGIKGIIIDGLVRDKRELNLLNIQIYAKGFISAGPRKDGPGAFDETITCGGVVASPNDYIVADEDGVVIIPQEGVEQTLKRAEEKLTYELKRLEKINDFPQNNYSEVDLLKPSWLDEALRKYI